MKFVKGQVPWNKGMPMREETKIKSSRSKKGKPSPLKGRGSSYDELLERFESKVEILITNCWKWNGHIEENGYGRFGIGSHLMVSAHRMSYILYKGPIDLGLTIDHLCKNKWCVNPNHLEPVTLKENLLRSNAITTINKNKQECDSGHIFSLSNTYIRPVGSRDCRICHCIAQKKYLKNKKRGVDVQ